MAVPHVAEDWALRGWLARRQRDGWRNLRSASSPVSLLVSGPLLLSFSASGIVVHVTQTAKETGEAARVMQDNSGVLVDQSTRLRGEVDELLARIRVA